MVALIALPMLLTDPAYMALKPVKHCVWENSTPICLISASVSGLDYHNYGKQFICKDGCLLRQTCIFNFLWYKTATKSSSPFYSHL